MGETYRAPARGVHAQVMVEVLKPEALRTEVSLEADLPQIAFRKLRQVGALACCATQVLCCGR